MKPFTLGQASAPGYGDLLERIEILRSSLRWANRLERAEIQRLLEQCNALRDEVLDLSRKQRFVQASASVEVPGVDSPGVDSPGVDSPGVDSQPPEPEAPAKRRAALLARDFAFEGVFGENPRLLHALEVAEKAAPTDLPVLIRGESGTGKELLAKVVHANGGRAGGPFISVNCGAIPENLLESELFGHQKGAFTGAVADRKGRFESANGGTIFLDEIGELPLSGQVKLLRVLQSREIQRVGSDRTIQVDTRIVAATNRDLPAMVGKGGFREDLYYRLSVIEVTLPPLRERRDEIPLLIEFFCGEAAERLNRPPITLDPDLRRFLLAYRYPGNIRELHNLIFRISCLAGEMARMEHLPDSVRASPTDQTTTPTEPASLSEARKVAGGAAERQFLEQGLREVKGRVVELARRHGMNRSYLQTLMKKHGLRARDFRKTE